MDEKTFIEAFNRIQDSIGKTPGETTWAPPTAAAKERLAICNRCPDRRACALWKRTSCQAMALLSRPAECCPADPPRWGPIRDLA